MTQVAWASAPYEVALVGLKPEHSLLMCRTCGWSMKLYFRRMSAAAFGGQAPYTGEELDELYAKNHPEHEVAGVRYRKVFDGKEQA